MPRSVSLGFVAFALLVASSPVRALDDPDTEIARRHFTEGSALYEQKNYEKAIEAFEAARRVKPLPAFDFNIARCHDRLGHWAKAVEAYERYLAEKPDVPDAAELRERVKLLRGRIAVENAPAIGATAAPKATPSTTPEPVRAEAGWRRLLLPAGVGALALGAGVASTVVLLGVDADYNAFDHGTGACRPCKPDVVDALRTRADVGYALAGVGGAALVVDALLWTRALRRPGEAPVVVVPTVGGVAVAGAF